MVRLIYYRSKCIGCNACVEAAPFRWRVSQKDGRCKLINGVEKRGVYSVLVANDEIQSNKIAARNCPVNCIQVLENH